MKNQTALLLKDFSKKAKSNSWRVSKTIVIYTRVSSFEQAMYNTSLESQRKECTEFAAKKGYTVKAYFGGTYESAKNDERKEFKKMIELVNRDKSISAILVYSYERFSRSENASNLSRKLEAIGVKVLSVFQEIDVTTASGKMQQTMFYAFGNYDNEIRKDKSVKGMIVNLKQGYWVAACPFGYTNTKRKEKARDHQYIINGDGELLKLGFKWKAEGKLSNLEIVQKLQKLGCKINYKSFVRIINNPFYCGYITHSLIPGEFYKGHHPVLVSENVFFKANNAVNLNPHKGISKKVKIEELPLKSFAKDEISLSPFTGYQQKGIYYYKTRAKGSCVNVKAEHLNSLFVNQLGKLEFGMQHIARLEQYMNQILNEKLSEHLKVQTQAKKIITDLNAKLENLELRFINGEFDKELYQKYRFKFQEEIDNLTKENVKGTLGSSNLEKAVIKGLQIAQKAKQIWLSSDYDDKQRLQYLIYPQGILYNKQNDIVRTPIINSFFSLIPVLSRDTATKKNDYSSKNNRHSHLVVPTETL